MALRSVRPASLVNPDGSEALSIQPDGKGGFVIRVPSYIPTQAVPREAVVGLWRHLGAILRRGGAA